MTFQDLYTQCQDESADATTASLVFFKRNINLGLRMAEAEIGSYYDEKSKTGSTTLTGIIQLPENCLRVKSLTIAVGGFNYNPQPIYDEDLWRALTASTTSVTSNAAERMLVRRTTLELFPVPSSVNTYTMIYEQLSKDLSADNYTTGTITTLANGGTAVTGSGTTWTSAMIGRMFRVDADLQWYEIATVPSTTSLTLVKPYQGTAISAGTSAHTIGEVPYLPEPTHILGVYYALWRYYAGVKKDKTFAAMYESSYEKTLQWAKDTYSRRYSSQVIPSQRRSVVGRATNSNWYPKPLT